MSLGNTRNIAEPCFSQVFRRASAYSVCVSSYLKNSKTQTLGFHPRLQLQHGSGVPDTQKPLSFGKITSPQNTAPILVLYPKDLTMNHSINRIAASALFALAAGAFLPAHAATDADLAGSVQSALSNSLGGGAKDMTVTAHNGAVTLHGWAQGPVEESKARYVASTVPGVAKAFSKVRTYSTDNNE